MTELTESTEVDDMGGDFEVGSPKTASIIYQKFISIPLLIPIIIIVLFF